MTRRKRRAEKAIAEVRERASNALEALVDGAESLLGRAKRESRKGRRSIERSARKAERQLGRFWNRGRFRVRRVRRKATRQIDRVADRIRSD